MKFYIIIAAICVFAFLSCSKVVESGPKDNLSSFNDLWSILDKNYGLFSVKNVDWDSVYLNYRSRISPQMTEEQFFKVCSDMLDQLRDGHLLINGESRTYNYTNFYTLYPRNFNWNNVLQNYLFNDLDSIGPFHFKVDQGLSYIRYPSFLEGFSNSDLDSVMKTFAPTRGIIIDVRGNLGGSVRNATLFASRFFRERMLVKYERFRNGTARNAFSDPVPYYVSPALPGYYGKVVVLTNRSCFSACNDFVLFMSRLPNVTVIGDQTGGGGSIPVNYVMINGWKLQYSSSLTLSSANVPVEDGIKPSISETISSIDEVNGRDPILERAILLLK
jgi:hypothetical protein